MDEYEELIKAYEDISSLIGASTAVRKGTLSAEEMRSMLVDISHEWNDRGLLNFFLTCAFNKMAHLHARVADGEGMSPENLLETEYRKMFGEN